MDCVESTRIFKELGLKCEEPVLLLSGDANLLPEDFEKILTECYPETRDEKKQDLYKVAKYMEDEDGEIISYSPEFDRIRKTFWWKYQNHLNYKQS
jgi:hypothetical protein